MVAILTKKWLEIITVKRKCCSSQCDTRIISVVKNHKCQHWCLLVLLVVGDVPLEVLTQIVATLSDPSAMLGPEVWSTFYMLQNLFYFFFFHEEYGVNPGVTYLDWKRSSKWLESWEVLLLATDVLTNSAEAIFRVFHPCPILWHNEIHGTSQ